jgi:exodeoxyribonuclease X
MIRVRVLDVETTGMPEAEGGAEIVEIGWCDVAVELDDPVPGAVRAWIEPGRWGSQLCNPGRPIPPEAMVVHHIRDAEVAAMPLAATVLANVMGGGADYFAAHNADFERKFITHDVKWICSYKVALRLWPDASHHSNQFLRYFLPLQLDDEALAMPPDPTPMLRHTS